MAETKNEVNNLDLTNTIQVNGKTFNVNAVHSEASSKVDNRLTIHTAQTSSDKDIHFDGSNYIEVSVVSEEHGAKFNAPVEVPTIKDSDIADTSVLNYKNITDTVLKELINNSISYTWKKAEGVDELELSPSVHEGTIGSISIISGLEEDLDEFAEQNEKFSAYLYICTDESKNIYYGSGKETPIQLASHATKADNADTADKANSADKLSTATNISVDLTKSGATTFDGSKDVDLGVKGTLQIVNGGTGATTERDARNNLITNAPLFPQNIKINSSDQWQYNFYDEDLRKKLKYYGLDLSNSDIINTNGIYFADEANSIGEGIHFVRTLPEDNPDNKYTWDVLYAKKGKVYFGNNIPSGDTAQFTTYSNNISEILHTGNTGTGADDIAVGKANNIRVRYGTSPAVYHYSTITISTANPSGGSTGDIWIKI